MPILFLPLLIPLTLQALLDHGAKVDAAGKNGRTALHLAASYGRIDIAQVDARSTALDE